MKTLHKTWLKEPVRAWQNTSLVTAKNEAPMNGGGILSSSRPGSHQGYFTVWSVVDELQVAVTLSSKR